MNRALALAALAAALTASGCEHYVEPINRVGQATIKFANGQPAGTAQFYDTGTQVSMTVGLAGFTPGVHGIHLHTTGRCDPPDFTSAGGHLNPGGHQHGTDNPQGAHLGDLPNITVDRNGTGTLTTTLTGMPADVLADLFDADGTAVVVHEGPDDYRTDPSGASGSRVACGVVTKL